jgi:hypothetical protein
MKESKFIELLNLYIDHQISSEEAGVLEEEILRNPQRRQTYHQYCRMQRACTLVLDQFKAPAGAAGQRAGEIGRFESSGRRPRWGYYAAGLAAAAGVALVAMQGFLHSGGSPDQLAAPPLRNSALVKSDPIQTGLPVRLEAPAARLPAQTELFIADRLRRISPIGTPDSLPLVFSTSRDPLIPQPLPEAPPAARSLRPSIEQFVFGLEQPNPDTPKIFRNRRQTDEEAVRAALQYHR